MARNRAEYMRDYRAKRTKAEREATVEMVGLVSGSTSEGDVAVILGQSKRITELEAEVKHLKAELAKRQESMFGVRTEMPRTAQDFHHGSFNSRPFTPAPKKGK